MEVELLETCIEVFKLVLVVELMLWAESYTGGKKKGGNNSPFRLSLEN